MKRWALTACVFWVSAGSAAEVGRIEEDFASYFLNYAQFSSESECRSELDQRREVYIEVEAERLAPLVHIVSAHRLICEKMRINDEIRRLVGEKENLLRETERLDALWLVAHRANPKKFPDFPGRDRSQRIMRADAEAIEFAIQNLVVVAAALENEAVRLLKLSVADIGRHTMVEKRKMRIAIEADERQLAASAVDEKSLFQGFKDLLPKAG